MIRRVFAALLLSSAGVAHAADKPVYAPAPDWVKPAPPIDVSQLSGDAPIYLVLDNQQKLEGGQVWSYFETDTRVASNDVLNGLGTITLPWSPDKGDLIIHKMEIIRGTEHIDLLANGAQPFTVLRREQQLEQLQINGILSATTPVEGLRVGDVLRVAFSITQKDPTLKGNVQAFAQLVATPFRVQFARARLIWPHGTNIHWKMDAAGDPPLIATVGKYDELTVTEPLAKQPDMPADAPQRFHHPTILEAGSFDNWAAISKIMAPLYVTDGLIAPGSPLAAEVDKIKAAETDPLKRAALALQLVQDKVRYLFKGMDNGNYVPQAPTQTWSLRYGDCKAKTLLLLSLLHAMNIDAEAVMANIQLGDLIPDRLPTPGAFDHVLVRATINGETLWLDGTDSGARLTDIHDTPPFRNVLPVRAAGADLMSMAMKPITRPLAKIDITLDESAGVNMPAAYTFALTVRGQLAQLVHTAQVQGGKEALKKIAAETGKHYLDNPLIIAPTLAYDDAASTATLNFSGVTYPDWNRENERYRSSLDRAVSAINFDPDRSRTAWRDIPVSTGAPETVWIHTTVRAPDAGQGFTLDGDQALSTTLAGNQISRTTTLANGTITIDERVATTGAEIPAAEIGTNREKLAQAKEHLLRLVAPTDYPAQWQVIEASRKAHRFDALLAAYKQNIDTNTDDSDVGPYTNRAWFEELTYDRQAAIADLSKAIASAPSADIYLWRARLYTALDQDDKATADVLAARKIDPSSEAAVTQLADLYADHGKKDDALALLDERISAGGKDKPDFMAAKAQVLGDTGEKDAAISMIDSAIADTPGNPMLLNSRCWIKGTLNVALDTALKDCTKAIELTDAPTGALDSRAMVYFRLNRYDDALADLNAALESDPEKAESMYMRGIIRRKTGDAKDGDADLAAARLISPTIDKDYAKYGIAP